MNSKNNRNFIKGSVREPAFAKGSGDVLNISLNLDELAALITKNAAKHTGGYVKISLSRHKDGVDQFGNSHYIYEDEYVPKPKGEAPAAKKEDKADDLPF